MGNNSTENAMNHPWVNCAVGGRNKIFTAHEAVRLINSGDIVATGGFVGSVFAEEVAIALEEYFLKEGLPKNLTLIYAAGQGDGKEKGLNHLAHEGLIDRVVAGHLGLAPKLGKMAVDNRIRAYNLPQGVISHMFRDIAAHKPRTITTVGLETYIDPRYGGGKMNALTTDDIVELINFDGKEYLAYKLFPVNVAIIRGTTADMDGNVTMEKEALVVENLAMAMAAKNSGGVVIVQVERIAEKGSLNSRQVQIPGILVDCIVVARAENHWQTFAQSYNPSFSGEVKIPLKSMPRMKLDARKIIARRAALELQVHDIVNLGIGVPEGVANVANEERILDCITLTAEPGIIGGVPAGGLNFGAASNTQCLIDQPSQFDYYDGGGLTIACLGMAQADGVGNVNVSKFGSRFVGCGGFINISQNARKCIFMGTFSAGGLQIATGNGRLAINREGNIRKFVDQVEQVTYSGTYGARQRQYVLYVTERCVFSLTPEGLELIEIAPGIDMERDVLSQMDFRPIVRNVRYMDERLFRVEPMNLIDTFLDVFLKSRWLYSPEENHLSVNLDGLYLDSAESIEAIGKTIADSLGSLGKSVAVHVNDSRCSIAPELKEEYEGMLAMLAEHFELESCSRGCSDKPGMTGMQYGVPVHGYSNG